MYYWMRKNLFNRWYNTALTVLLAALVVYLSIYAVRYIFFTAQWQPVRANLTLFMIGSFPRSEQWRVIAQIYLIAASFGLFWGAMIASSKERAHQAGLPHHQETLFETFKRWWPVLLFLAVLLVAAWGVQPLIFAVTAIALTLAMRRIARRVPTSSRILIWLMACVGMIASWQVVSGTSGRAWVWGAVLLAVVAVRLLRRWDYFRDRWEDWIAQKEGFLASSLMQAVLRYLPTLGVVLVCFAVSFGLYRSILSFDGVGWDKWSGFHLNLTAAAISIVAAFPLGLLLAMGRRSNLPVIRWLCVTYIELIRGVPLIGLLFIANSLLGFFIDNDSIIGFFLETPLSQISRAIVIMSLFTAAYLAEIIRGGLLSVPNGQREGGQSVGLTPWQNTTLVIMPQAIRSVIPSIVGQFISLLKDSSLLYVIAVTEILRARLNVHAQGAFTTIGTSETLVFIAFAFWCFAFIMSRESQKLEEKLGVGTR